MTRLRQREAEISALYETANDLIAIRDVDAILTAIVRRARQLLNADMTYLSLNDKAEGASYMKVTDGSVSAEFRNLRLPLGTGLLGLVAQSDARFLHRDFIDHAVGDENIRAILGVPLIVEGKVIGALLATHRTVRPFPSGRSPFSRRPPPRSRSRTQGSSRRRSRRCRTSTRRTSRSAPTPRRSRGRPVRTTG